MIERLSQWLFRHIYKNEEDRRLARILLTLIIAYWFASLIVLILDQVWGNKFLTPYLIAGATLQFIPILLLRYGKLAASGFANAMIYLVLTTYFAAVGQGIHDYAIILYPIIIMMAGLTGHRRGLLWFTTIALAAIAWLILGEINGWIFPVIVPSRWPDAIAAGLLILTGSLAVYLFVSNLEYGLVQTWHELAERKRMEAALRESEENLKEIIESSSDNIFVVDVDKEGKYKLKKINNALEKVFNTDRSNIEGRYLDEIVDKESAEKIKLKYAQCVRTEAPLSYEEFDESAAKTYSTNLIPIIDQTGNVVRLIGISRDITERKRAEEDLIRNEKFIRNINDNLVSGMIYQVLRFNDGTRKFTYLSDSVQRFYGVTAEKAMENPDLIYGKIYPEDQLDLMHKEEEANRTLSVFHGEFRMINPDGSVRWSSFTSNPTPMEDGTTCWDGIELDITEQKQAEDALQQSREMYRLLAENVSDVIWIYDVNEDRTRYISPSVERLRGYTAEEVLANNKSLALTPASQQYVASTMPSRIQSFQAGHRGFYVDELEQSCKDGSTVWVEATTSFHINKENGHVEIYGVSRNISERKRLQDKMRNYILEIEELQEELRDQAVRDPLTGLYNRRYMEDSVMREFTRAARENYPVSVIIIDMDELKMFNDTYGHQYGDEAILLLGSQLQNMIRAEDIMCRYGGDEFVVIMGRTMHDKAAQRVNEWRDTVRSHPLLVHGQKIPVRFTAGVASFPHHGISPDEVIKCADMALYRGKAKGRNCTVVFE